MIKKIPAKLLDQFTMNGAISVYTSLHDNTTSNVNAEEYTKAKVQEYIVKAKNGGLHYYKYTDKCLHKAINKFPISGKDVLLFGSGKPWYEAFCLSYGCKSVTITEYKLPSLEYKGLTYVHVDKIQGLFDVALSISTFEHSGLGRYGDLIDPDGDLKAMQQAKKLLRPNGLLYLAVPVNQADLDFIEWNAHRVYGTKRLSLLFKGWEVVEKFGHREGPSILKGKPNKYQPVFILRNKE